MSYTILKSLKAGIGIGVDKAMPGRKKPCLVVFDGNCETKYASFNNEYAADRFMEILADFVGIEKEADQNDHNEPEK